MNLWPPPYQRVALTNWAICLYFWTSLWELNPWKRILQILPITILARDDMGMEGIEPSLQVSQTCMLKNQYITYPITFQRDRIWTCNHWYPKPAFYHLKYSLLFLGRQRICSSNPFKLTLLSRQVLNFSDLSSILFNKKTPKMFIFVNYLESLNIWDFCFVKTSIFKIVWF